MPHQHMSGLLPPLATVILFLLIPNAATEVSVSSCTDLGWEAERFGSPTVCASSELEHTQPICEGLVTFEEAASACALAGARLCTFEEINADETRGTGCGLDSAEIWSSSPCDGGYLLEYGAINFQQSEKTCSDSQDLHNFRCCADWFTVEPTPSPTASASEEITPETSVPTAASTNSPETATPTVNLTPAPTAHPVLIIDATTGPSATPTFLVTDAPETPSPTAAPETPSPTAAPEVTATEPTASPTNPNEETNSPSPLPTTVLPTVVIFHEDDDIQDDTLVQSYSYSLGDDGADDTNDEDSEEPLDPELNGISTSAEDAGSEVESNDEDKEEKGIYKRFREFCSEHRAAVGVSFVAVAALTVAVPLGVAYAKKVPGRRKKDEGAETAGEDETTTAPQEIELTSAEENA